MSAEVERLTTQVYHYRRMWLAEVKHTKLLSMCIGPGVDMPGYSQVTGEEDSSLSGMLLSLSSTHI